MVNQNVILATKTMERIDAMIQEDQGSAFRGWLQKVLPHIGDAYRTDEDGHRSHLGASVLGKECGRAIWYSFRWATKSNHIGRMVRLFNRGHLEEGRFIAMLLMIGCKVYQQDEHGKQFRISYANGHAGGSGDGVVIGLPDLESGTPALCEFKTHNEKSFTELKEKGVREAKTEHYIQMQMYMRRMGLAVALYAAVNKNTDELYMELVPLNSEFADQCFERGEKLVQMPNPPGKISQSPGFYKCRFCDHRPVCHLDKAPDRNCRTCEHSYPDTEGDARWMCRLHNCALSKERQLRGCDQYQLKSCF